VLSADPGVYVLTGADAALIYVPVVGPGAYELDCEPGVYLVTGAPLKALLELDSFPSGGTGGGAFYRRR